MLAAPEEHDPHEQRRCYWTTMLHLLVFRLGWSSPERGLIWWAEQGYPTSDPTLALVDTVWRTDGRLPLLMDWLAAQPLTFMPQVADESYLSALSERRRPPRRFTGYGPWDSPWQLHLEGPGGHLVGPLNSSWSSVSSSPKASVVRDQNGGRSATLTSTSMFGWYAALQSAALPDLPDDRSWRVRVYVNPVGYLGTFRKSRVSGAWFVGRHSVHIQGH